MFCVRSLFSDVELGGRLNLRKFSVVKVEIELFRMNGMKVRVVIIVFGKRCCYMIILFEMFSVWVVEMYLKFWLCKNFVCMILIRVIYENVSRIVNSV